MHDELVEALQETLSRTHDEESHKVLLKALGIELYQEEGHSLMYGTDTFIDCDNCGRNLTGIGESHAFLPEDTEEVFCLGCKDEKARN